MLNYYSSQSKFAVKDSNTRTILIFATSVNVVNPILMCVPICHNLALKRSIIPLLCISQYKPICKPHVSLQLASRLHPM